MERKIEISPSHTLENIDPETIPFLPGKEVRMKAKVVDVYDGDTVTIVYQYEGIFLKTKIRVLGIDTPEMKVSSKGKGVGVADLEKRAARHVTSFVKELIEGEIVEVNLTKFDKFGGRVNGEIFIGEETLTEILVGKRYARSYGGEKKEDWTEEELNYILKN